MSRPKGSKNKKAIIMAPSSLLSSKERINFLATVMVDELMRLKAVGKSTLALSKVKDE
jgi:hypothetical protein